MRLTGVEQHTIETALDEALVAPGDPRTVVKVERALRILRERPEGERGMRVGEVRLPDKRDIWGETWDPT